MVIDILNKVLILLVILSSLNIIRHGFFMVKSIREEERFVLDKPSLFFLGLSISYIILFIIDGILI